MRAASLPVSRHRRRLLKKFESDTEFNSLDLVLILSVSRTENTTTRMEFAINIHVDVSNVLSVWKYGNASPA